MSLLFLASLPTAGNADAILDVVRGVETDLGARVGFYMNDTQTGTVITYGGDDRFPMNSTFKLLACGALLRRVEDGAVNLHDSVRLGGFEIVDYSPAITRHIDAGHREISLGDACGMMLSVSDNTAANIVLTAIGGPKGLNAFLRSIGDHMTRLDRWETALNEAAPGDPRDTTTPAAMAVSVQRLLLGDALTTKSRDMLKGWLSGHSVADGLFRAALPPAWSIYDRTGAGGFGSRSIVAVMYPPGRAPVVAALFVTETAASFKDRNAAAARVGKAIVDHIAND